MNSPKLSRILPVLTPAILLFGILYRLRLLQEPVRFDEAYSMLHYAVQPLSLIVSDYSFPNNHVLHTLAMHFTHLLFGISVPGLRLPAFMAGIGVLGFMTWFAWDLSRDKWVVFFAALLGSTSYPLVHFSVNGRGYSMQMLFTLMGALILWRWARGRKPLASLFLLSLSLFGLLYTIPSGIIVALPLFIGGLALAIYRRNVSRAAYTLLAFTLCVLLLISAWGSAVKTMIHWTSSVSHSPFSILGAMTQMAADGIGPLPLCGIALIAGLRTLSRKNKDAALLMTIVLFGYSVLLLLFGKWLPLPVMFDRSYTPLFPLAYVVMAMGLVDGLRWLYRPGYGAILASAGAGLLIVFGLRASVLVLQDPARLYFPERATMAAGRELIPPLAMTLQRGETIAGTGLALDTAAAYYVTQARGFNGFYSLFEPQQRKLRTVYVLTEDPSSLQPVWKDLSSWSQWTTPEKVAVSGNVSVFRMKRLNPD